MGTEPGALAFRHEETNEAVLSLACSYLVGSKYPHVEAVRDAYDAVPISSNPIALLNQQLHHLYGSNGSPLNLEYETETNPTTNAVAYKCHASTTQGPMQGYKVPGKVCSSKKLAKTSACLNLIRQLQLIYSYYGDDDTIINASLTTFSNDSANNIKLLDGWEDRHLALFVSPCPKALRRWAREYKNIEADEGLISLSSILQSLLPDWTVPDVAVQSAESKNQELPRNISEVRYRASILFEALRIQVIGAWEPTQAEAVRNASRLAIRTICQRLVEAKFVIPQIKSSALLCVNDEGIPSSERLRKQCNGRTDEGLRQVKGEVVDGVKAEGAPARRATSHVQPSGADGRESSNPHVRPELSQLHDSHAAGIVCDLTWLKEALSAHVDPVTALYAAHSVMMSKLGNQKVQLYASFSDPPMSQGIVKTKMVLVIENVKYFGEAEGRCHKESQNAAALRLLQSLIPGIIEAECGELHS